MFVIFFVLDAVLRPTVSVVEAVLFFYLILVLPIAGVVTALMFRRRKKLHVEIRADNDLKVGQPVEASVTLRAFSDFKALVIEIVADFAEVDFPTINVGQIAKGETRAVGVSLKPKRTGPQVLGVYVSEGDERLEIAEGLFLTVNVRAA